MDYRSSSSAVAAHRVANILHIRLERPDRGNALTYEMMGAVEALCRVADGDRELRGVFFEGTGDSFCIGEDRESPGPWPDALAHRRPGGSHGPAPLPQQGMLKMVRALTKPTVAVLHGHTVGLGFDLACVCDIRVAAEDATIGDDRILNARHAGTGITHVLPRLIGQSLANRFLLLGEMMNGREAARIGLVHVVCQPDDLAAEASRFEKRLSTMATRSYAVIKQQVIEELDMPYETALMHSIAIRQTNVIQDRAEGALAFREKRAARFVGR